MLDWENLEKTCHSCTNCGLCEKRHNVVFGVGPRTADVMFIGEGPGEQEDLQGEPFVGPAGKLLDDMLSIIDLSRENCYIANIVKCRPPGNRDPLETEQDACIGYLRNQVALIHAFAAHPPVSGQSAYFMNQSTLRCLMHGCRCEICCRVRRIFLLRTRTRH